MAAEDGGRGLYLKFVHVVCSDVQYLLDEILRVLPEVGAPPHRLLSASHALDRHGVSACRLVVITAASPMAVMPGSEDCRAEGRRTDVLL